MDKLCKRVTVVTGTISPVVESVFDEVMEHGGLGFAAVARKFPAHRGDAKSLDSSTVFRWHARGVRGPSGAFVKLAAIRVGGKFVTSEAAVRRFVATLSEPALEPAPPRSPAARNKASAAAAKQLEKMGA